MANDPYAAPKSRVEDVEQVLSTKFLPGGQAVAFGNGWQWIAQGWALFMRQPGTWILMCIVAGVIFIALSLIPVAGFVATSLLWPVLWAGFLIACRDLERGEEMRFGHLFAGFRGRAGALVALGVFFLLATIVIFVVGALIAGLGVSAMFNAVVLGRPDEDFAGGGAFTLLLWILVILGLSIPLYMAGWFAPGLVALQDQSIGDALRTSFRACLKNILPFLLYGLILFAFAIVASIPLMLGWLAFGPVLMASVYASYRDIFTEH